MSVYKSTTLSNSVDNVTPANKAWHTALLADLAAGLFKDAADDNAFAAFDSSREAMALGAGGTYALDTYFQRQSAGLLAARNAADDDFIRVQGASPTAGDDFVTKTYADAGYIAKDGSTPLTGDWNTGLTNGITVPWLQLDTSFSDGSVEGRLQWNSEDGTMEYGLPGGNVTLQVGQEQLVRARNVSGVGITNGLVVYVSGSAGTGPEISLADASVGNGLESIGVATETIPNNSWGYVNVGGLVRAMDTSAVAEGGTAYLSETTPGTLRATAPDAPNSTTVVGYCISQHASTGILLVRIHARPKMQSMSDVDHTAPSSDGQIYAWDQSGDQRFELVDHGTLQGLDLKVYKVAGDAQPVFQADRATGAFNFGAGGATALDSVISRQAAGYFNIGKIASSNIRFGYYAGGGLTRAFTITSGLNMEIRAQGNRQLLCSGGGANDGLYLLNSTTSGTTAIKMETLAGTVVADHALMEWVQSNIGPTNDRFFWRAENSGGVVSYLDNAGVLWLPDGVTAPAAKAGFFGLYVDTADGDLKVVFGDGTVKVISVDT